MNLGSGKVVGYASTQVAAIESPDGRKSSYGGYLFELDARDGSGAFLNSKTRMGKLSGQDITMVDVDAGYHFRKTFGPTVGYRIEDILGTGSDRYVVGISMDYDLDEDISVSSSLLSNVDKFGDEREMTIGATYSFTPLTSISAEYQRSNFGETQAEGGNVGLKIGLSSSVYLDGRMQYREEGDLKMRGISLGLGLNF